MQRKGIRVNPSFGDSSGLKFSRLRARTNKRRGDKILSRRKTVTTPDGRIVALQVVPYNGRKPTFAFTATKERILPKPYLGLKASAREEIWITGGATASWSAVPGPTSGQLHIVDGGKTSQPTNKVLDGGLLRQPMTATADGGKAA